MFNIHTLNYYLPEKKIPVEKVVRDIFDLYPIVEDVDAYCKDLTTEGKLSQITIGDDVDLLDCYYTLIGTFFKKNPDIDPKDVMYLVYTMNYQERFTSEGINIPYALVNEFGMNNASVVKLDQSCATSVYSLGLLSKLQCEGTKHAIILTSYLGRNLWDRFWGNSITGDAVAMAVLSTEDYRFKILDSLSNSNGTYSYNLMNKSQVEIPRETFMNTGVDLIQRLLKRNNLQLSDIKQVIPQTVNHKTYLYFAKKLNLPVEKLFLDSIPNGGHLGDVDTIRNLKDYVERSDVKKGDYMVVYGLGPDGEYDFLVSACLIQKI